MKRQAFTMIELLVVIAIVAVLGAVGIYFVSSFRTSERASRGAGWLQQSLVAARQKAIRDQRPHGLRLSFYVDGTNPADPIIRAKTLSYVETPDDFGSGRYWDSATNAWLSLQLRADPGGAKNKVWVTDSNGKPVINFGPGLTSAASPIAVGDMLELNGAGLMHRIVGSAASGPPGFFDVLVLASDVPTIGSAISNFRITRAPRVVGDEVISLPADKYEDSDQKNGVVIDAATNLYWGTGLPLVSDGPNAAHLDIMFSPSGNAMTQERIILWVRSTASDDYFGTAKTKNGYWLKLFGGEPSLIVVYPSGLAASYPVEASDDTKPYQLVQP